MRSRYVPTPPRTAPYRPVPPRTAPYSSYRSVSIQCSAVLCYAEPMFRYLSRSLCLCFSGFHSLSLSITLMKCLLSMTHAQFYPNPPHTPLGSPKEHWRGRGTNVIRCKSSSRRNPATRTTAHGQDGQYNTALYSTALYTLTVQYAAHRLTATLRREQILLERMLVGCTKCGLQLEGLT